MVRLPPELKATCSSSHRALLRACTTNAGRVLSGCHARICTSNNALQRLAPSRSAQALVEVVQHVIVLVVTVAFSALTPDESAREIVKFHAERRLATGVNASNSHCVRIEIRMAMWSTAGAARRVYTHGTPTRPTAYANCN